MKLVEDVVDFIEELSYWASTMFHQNISDQLSIETADSQNTLVMRDGSLMSIIRLHGTRKIVGQEEFEALNKGVHSSLESYMSSSNGGHAIQVFFQHDRDRIGHVLRHYYAPSVRAGNQIGFDISDIIEDRVKALSTHCHVEDCFFVLRTRVDAVTKSEIKRSRELQDAAVKKKKGAIAILAQNPIIAIDALRDRHQSFVKSFNSDMNSLGIISTVLSAHEACYEIRKTIDPEFTAEEWRPYLPGDKFPARLPLHERDDISNILWPKLSTQLIPRSGVAIDHQMFKIGNRIYASVSVDLPPKNPTYFNVLFKRMMANNIPWRASFGIQTGGLKSVHLKRVMAAITGILHSDNKLIVDGYKDLENNVRILGDVDVRMTMSFTTWVSDGDIKKLSSRLSMLARAVEGWGTCEVSEMPGDPMTGFMTSVLGQTADGFTVPCAANLREVVPMLPITRNSSPWTSGSLIFRTPDGKPWPFQPGSSKQIAWIDLIVAGMGSGKSVLMNSINQALCTDPRNKRLPRIVTIDIGPSSEGLISLLKDQLPEGRKHEAAYHRLRMTKECSINPFDTPLGSRFPISSHMMFLRNYILLLVTQMGETKPYDGMPDMVGVALEAVYKNLSDGENPRKFDFGVDDEVDAMLERLSIKVDKRSTWWEVVDELYTRGKIREASLAQRYAVPVLDDLIAAARSDQIRNMFNITLPTNESLVEGFCRMISTSVTSYPIISRPTKFDIGEARIVSLDLDEVAKSGLGEAADRQCGIMYMLARFILARDFYMTEDNIPELNGKYLEYHRRRIKENSEDIKRICIDEFHRTKNVQAVRDQVLIDIREGRKWGVHVALASQDIHDFDSTMISLATNVFIMGKFDNKEINHLDSLFALGETAKYALANTTHGPRPGVGTTFLVNMVTNDSNTRTSQVITSTIGPIEYWAFSTTAEDKVIRSMLYNKIGGVAARSILSRTYPWGIASEVTRRGEDLTEEAFDEKKRQSIIDNIHDEVLKQHFDETRLTA